MTWRASLSSTAFFAALAFALVPACSQGEGTGAVCGTLDVPDCWAGPFNLHPDFFAAVPDPSSDAMQVRVQSGGDYENFSDGLAILIDDAGQIRGDPTSQGFPRPSLLGQTLVVGLPPGVTPPGVPLEAVSSPSIVHAVLYLERTCGAQNDALYAVSAVALNPDGTCEGPDLVSPLAQCQPPATLGDGGITGLDGGATNTDGGTTPVAGGGLDASSSAPDAMAGIAACPAEVEGGSTLVESPGTSTIVFTNLFDGNEAETNAQKRLTDAQFDLYFADPREVCPGGLGPPPPCRGHLSGYMRFYFERGQPAQPFP